MFLSTPFHPQISSFSTFVIIWGQARVMRGGWKCMEAARQSHGCHMSGLTVLTNWIMMACRWIVVGSQNWKTSLSCCRRSMRSASRCSGSREWEHLTVGWSITTIWMSAPSWKHKKKGEGCGGRSKSGFYQKVRGGENNHRPSSQKYDNTCPCQKIVGHDVNALYQSTILEKMPCRPGKVTHYENSAKAGWVQKQPIPKSVDWFCRGWHPCPQRVVDKIRWIPTIVFQQLYPIQSDCGAHERVFAMNQESWDTNWKALWKADREKDLALRPAIGMVPWAWSRDHGLNHWPPTPKNINMVHKRGDRK